MPEHEHEVAHVSYKDCGCVASVVRTEANFIPRMVEVAVQHGQRVERLPSHVIPEYFCAHHRQIRRQIEAGVQ